MSELRFDGRTVIVTGAGRGFGRCHAMLLAARGANVVVADNGANLDGTGSSREPAEQVVKEITAAGGTAVACFESVVTEDGAVAIVQTALDAFGRLDVLVNNAGIVDPDWFAEQDLDRFRRMEATHYWGTVNTTRAAWSHLLAAPHGCIVNITSEAILGGVPKSASYAAAKGAVFAFTRALALDGRRSGVRANAVAPRGNTRMSGPDVLSIFYDQPVEDFKNEFFDRLLPEYVSPAVAYLAHDSCPLTGETLICGGGQAMRLAMVRSAGIHRDVLTPEDIAESIDGVLDLTDATLIGIDMI